MVSQCWEKGRRILATILIVEDHDNVRMALGDWLRLEFPGCRVLEAATVDAAIALVQREPPDLVVIDISLPGMSGIEATRRIKATLPSAQVVMVTIHQDNIYRADAAAAGASAFVAKLSMLTDLIPTLVALLGNDLHRHSLALGPKPDPKHPPARR